MPDKPKFYFIGGAPLTGKSTVISKLSDYTQISTDDIRSYLQKILKPEDNIDLFYGHNLDAVSFYKKYKDAKTVFNYEKRQANATQSGIDALIEVNFGFNKIAVEGIAITPQYINKLESENKIDMKWLFLYDSNEERIRKRIFERGLYDDAGKYPDWIKEIEVEWVLMYNNFYKSECQKYGYSIFNIDEIETIKL